MPQRSTLRHLGTAPAQPNQSVLAAIEVLMALSLESQPLGSHELARRLHWNVMRVNRMLKTLAYCGMAVRTPRGKYIAGAGLSVLAAQAIHASPLVQAARTIFGSSGADRTTGRTRSEKDGPDLHGHGLALGVLWQDKVCYLFHRLPDQPGPLEFGTHPPFEASRSSIGRLLMALRGDEAPGFDAIRRNGYCHTVQNRRTGEGSLAVPVGDTSAALAATSVPTAAAARRLLPRLRQLAAEIAEAAVA